MTTTAGAPAGFPVSRRLLSWDGESDGRDSELSLELEGAMLSDTVFRFLDGSPESSASSTSDDGYREINGVSEEEDDGGEEEGSATSIEENRAFWEKQRKILKETLCKTSSAERSIRNATKEAMKYAQAEGRVCVCSGTDVEVGSCKRCLMREISRRLRDRGFDCAVCRSWWRSSPEIPSGEHTFIVVTMPNSKPNKGEVKVIIELGFRAEFEMARAGEEYNQLISRLPEAFVGKADRLRALVKILCSAAKKCRENKKIHIGPWRKHKYMQAKWFSTCENMEAEPLVGLLDGSTDRARRSVQLANNKPKASMLTVALLDSVTRVQPKAVEVA